MLRIENDFEQDSEQISEQDSNAENCQHENINENNVCTNCGYMTNFISSDMSNSKSKCSSMLSSIKKKINNLDFLDDINIKSKAIEIANVIIKSGLIPKRTNRALIFFCVFKAYMSLDIVKDPNILGSKIGLNSSQVTKTISKYNSPDNSGYADSCISYIHPEDLVSEYCGILNLSNDIKEQIIDDFVLFLKKHPYLKEKSPRTLAVSYIKYYLDFIGFFIDNKEYADTFKFKNYETINKLVKYIKELENR